MIEHSESELWALSKEELVKLIMDLQIEINIFLDRESN